MALVLSEEQQMIKSSAKEFFNGNSPVAALRRLRDEKSDKGYDPLVWSQMVDMGWAGLVFSEEHGGLDFGYTGLGQILVESGKTLTTSPLMSTVVLGGSMINEFGTAEQKSALLPKISSGELLIAVAFEEAKAHLPFICKTAAISNNGHYEITGTKKFVLDGHISDTLLVSANTGDGISIFMVDPKSEGIKIERHTMMDSRNAATITFDKVKANEHIGAIDNGKEVLEKSLDIARLCLSAEMLGSIEEAFDRTIAYLKERRQFGVAIGSFQGLQHRAAHAYCEIELCKSVVIKALQELDAGSDDLAMYASLVKSKVGEVAKLISNEAIQMFGGIGMTDDEEIGFFLKRARVAQRTFGDYNYHLDRYAKLKGF